MSLEISQIRTSSPDLSSQQTHRIKDAAEKFEAMMAKELLRPLTEHDESDQGDSNALTSYGLDAMADSLAHAGGFGIAKLIEQQFSKG